MYSPDTFNRLNEAAVKKYYTSVKKGTAKCDHCDTIATMALPIYNPADSVRDVKGAVSVDLLCDDCYDSEVADEEVFTCDDCGDRFIRNHSWDNLTVVIDGYEYCHACGLKHIHQFSIADVIKALRKKEVSMFVRINTPTKANVIWDGEFSEYGDFSGHTSLTSVADEIEEFCKRDNVSLDTFVIPAITHTYQFSVVLSIFEHKE